MAIRNPFALLTFNAQRKEGDNSNDHVDQENHKRTMIAASDAVENPGAMTISRKDESTLTTFQNPQNNNLLIKSSYTAITNLAMLGSKRFLGQTCKAKMANVKLVLFTKIENSLLLHVSRLVVVDKAWISEYSTIKGGHGNNEA